MGGIGSGGHRWGKHRATVEACFRVDAKMLAPMFKVQPGQSAQTGWSYSSHGRKTGAVTAKYTAGADHLTLTLWREDTEKALPVRVSFTSCHYGGRRLWLHCPFCARRVFRLYLFPRWVTTDAKPINIFMCRFCMCGGLSYYLRNQKDPLSIGQTRCERIQRKLGERGADWDYLPDKPKWMRWNTYSRLAHELQAGRNTANRWFIESMSARFPEIAAAGLAQLKQKINLRKRT